jgi:uroporphyrinogen-III synthase
MSGALEGARVLLTRPEEDSEELARRIREAGGRPTCVPMIRIAPPEDPAQLREARAGLGGFDLIVVTSRHGARALLHGLPPGPRPRIAAVGESTASAVRREGWRVGRLSSGTGGARLAEEITSGESIAGRKILYPTSNLSRDDVPGRLRGAGGDVTVVEAYRTLLPDPGDRAVREIVRDIEAGRIDMVVFASPSAAANFAGLFAGGKAPQTFAAVAIGGTTAAALEDRGCGRVTKARRPDGDGLFDAVVESWQGRNKGREER